MIDPACAVRATASAVRERCAADAVSPHRRPTGCGVGDAASGVKRGWGAPRLNHSLPVRNRRTHCTGCAARPKASRLWAPRRRMQRRRWLKECKTGALPPAAQPRPTASSPLFSQIASRWFDILPWQPEEANLDLARAIPPPPRARHCTCPPARPSAILEEPPGFRRQDLRRDASEQPRWLISDASEHPRAEPTRLRDFV